MSAPFKARLLVVGTITLTAMIAGTGLALLLAQPSYRGKTLTMWLADFNRIPPDKPAPEAEQAIRSIGSKALPYLLAFIWSDEPNAFRKARLWINRTFKTRFRSRIDYCGASWRALSILGASARPALAEITRHAEQGPFSGRAMIALAAMGTNSVPALIVLCGCSNKNARIDAAILLAKSTDDMRWLKRSSVGSPFSGEPMLAYNIQEGPDDLEPFLKDLHHNHVAVRRATLEAISSRSEIRRNSESEIRECLKDPDPSVRELATNILNEIPEAAVSSRP